MGVEKKIGGEARRPCGAPPAQQRQTQQRAGRATLQAAALPPTIHARGAGPAARRAMHVAGSGVGRRRARCRGGDIYAAEGLVSAAEGVASPSSAEELALFISSWAAAKRQSRSCAGAREGEKGQVSSLHRIKVGSVWASRRMHPLASQQLCTRQPLGTQPRTDAPWRRRSTCPRWPAGSGPGRGWRQPGSRSR